MFTPRGHRVTVLLILFPFVSNKPVGTPATHVDRPLIERVNSWQHQSQRMPALEASVVCNNKVATIEVD